MSIEELEESLRSFGLFLVALIKQWIPALSFCFLMVLAILVQVFGWEDKVPPIIIWSLAILSFIGAAFGVFHNLRRDYLKLRQEKQEQLWIPLRAQLIEERKGYLPKLKHTLHQMREYQDKLAANMKLVLNDDATCTTILEIDKYISSNEGTGSLEETKRHNFRVQRAMNVRHLGLQEVLKDDPTWQSWESQLRELRDTNVPSELHDPIKECQLWMDGTAHMHLFLRYLLAYRSDAKAIKDIHTLVACEGELWGMRKATDKAFGDLNARIERLLVGEDIK